MKALVRRRLAAWLAEAAVALLALSERLDPIAEAAPRVHVPRPRPTVIAPVGRRVAFDVSAYRFVRGGDA